MVIAYSTPRKYPPKSAQIRPKIRPDKVCLASTCDRLFPTATQKSRANPPNPDALARHQQRAEHLSSPLICPRTPVLSLSLRAKYPRSDVLALIALRALWCGGTLRVALDYVCGQPKAQGNLSFRTGASDGGAFGDEFSRGEQLRENTSLGFSQLALARRCLHINDKATTERPLPRCQISFRWFSPTLPTIRRQPKATTDRAHGTFHAPRSQPAQPKGKRPLKT